MNVRRNRFLWPVLFLLLSVLFVSIGCGTQSGADTADRNVDSGSDADRGEDELIELRIGFGSKPDYSDLHNLKLLEILRDEYGIDPKPFYFEGEHLAYQAMAAGAVDISVGGLGAAIRLAQESTGEKPVMVSATVSTTDYVIVARPEIQTLMDLEGKKFGTSGPGAISDVIPRIVLAENGVDTEKVDWIRIGGTSARIAALHAGEIDAGAAHAAEGLTAAKQGLKILDTAAKYIPDYVQRGFFVNRSFLEANEDLVKKVVYADIDGARWAASNREEFNEFAKEHLEGLDHSLLDEAYQIMFDGKVWGVDGGIDQARLERTMEIELEIGNIEEILPVEEWTDDRFQRAYLEERGPANIY